MIDMQRRSRKNSGTMTLLRDWRQALQTPHVYRVGNSAFRVQSQFVILFVIILVFTLTLYTYPSLFSIVCQSNQEIQYSRQYNYNSTYPLTTPIKTASGITYKVAIISDLDLESKRVQKKVSWISYYKRGNLLWLPQKNSISVVFDEDNTTLASTLSMADRGMELSELVTFDGQLVTFDDRTGLVYHVNNDKAFPWVILMDGNGKDMKGFKSEWATVKDQHLYVGSMGKEWTTAIGDYVHSNPMWVKVISPSGEVHSVNWIDNYKQLRKALHIEFPGYMIHESGAWSDIHGSWFFLPRRCSGEQYHETKDELMSCNVLLQADDNFSTIKVTRIDHLQPTRGFSSFKFLPGSNDTIIIALKSEEFQGSTATYITAFKIDGTILLQDTKIANLKFEGLEFV